MWRVRGTMFWGEPYFVPGYLIKFQTCSFSVLFEWNGPQQFYKVETLQKVQGSDAVPITYSHWNNRSVT